VSAYTQEALQDDQFDRLQAFKQELRQGALFFSYNSLASLREQVAGHLTTTVRRMMETAGGQPPPAATSGIVALPLETRAAPALAGARPAVVTAPTPDVRVEVRVGVAGLRHAFPTFGVRPQAQIVLAVHVLNYSPQVVYVSSVVLELRSHEHLVFVKDAVTGQLQGKRALQPGEDFSFMMLPEEVFKLARKDDLVCALAIDALGREYRSSEESLKHTLDAIPRSEGGPA
jgi:hypothetical protein